MPIRLSSQELNDFQGWLKSKLSEPSSYGYKNKILKQFKILINKNTTTKYKRNFMYLTKRLLERYSCDAVLKNYDLIDTTFEVSGVSPVNYLLNISENGFYEEEELLEKSNVLLSCKSDLDFNHLSDICDYLERNKPAPESGDKVHDNFNLMYDNLFNILLENKDELFFSDLLTNLYNKSGKDLGAMNLNDLVRILVNYKEHQGEVVDFFTQLSENSIFPGDPDKLVRSYFEFKDKDSIETSLFNGYSTLFYDVLSTEGVFGNLKVKSVNNLMNAWEICYDYVLMIPGGHTIKQSHQFQFAFYKAMKESYFGDSSIEDKILALDQWSINLSQILKSRPEMYFNLFDLAIGGVR